MYKILLKNKTSRYERDLSASDEEHECTDSFEHDKGIFQLFGPLFVFCVENARQRSSVNKCKQKGVGNAGELLCLSYFRILCVCVSVGMFYR